MSDIVMFGNHMASETNSGLGGVQHKFQFENGYGASVIQNKISYVADEGLWELAVLGESGTLDYSTPLTDDVLGWLTAQEVAGHLNSIACLPKAAWAVAATTKALEEFSFDSHA